MSEEDFNTLFNDVGWASYHLISHVRTSDIQQKLRSIAKNQFLVLKKLYPEEQYRLDYSLGILYCHHEPPQYEKSNEYLQSALKRAGTQHEEVKVFNALGVLYEQQEQYEDVLSMYQQSLKKTDFKSMPLYNTAFVYEKLGRKEEAADAAHRSLEEMKKEDSLQHASDPQKTLKELIQRCSS